MASDEITVTRVRRFPPEIADEDIETVLKEWSLVGLDVQAQGTVIVVMDRSMGALKSEQGYQKYGDRWIWVDLAALEKASQALVASLQEEAMKEYEPLIKIGEQPIRIKKAPKTGPYKKGK
jgi:hypothetical protein